MSDPHYRDPGDPDNRRLIRDADMASGAILTAVLSGIVIIAGVIYWAGNTPTKVASNDAPPAVGMNESAPTAPAQKDPARIAPRP